MLGSIVMCGFNKYFLVFTLMLLAPILFSQQYVIHVVEGIVNYSDYDIAVLDGIYTWTDVDIGYAIPTATWTDVDVALTEDLDEADLLITDDFTNNDVSATIAVVNGIYTWTDLDIAVLEGAYTWTDVDIGFSFSEKSYTDYKIYVKDKNIDIKAIIAIFYFCFQKELNEM